MIARAAGVVLLLAAGLGYAGLVAPARREAAAARDGLARAREDRDRLRVRLADLERRVQVWARVTTAPQESSRGEAAGRLRRAVLRAVEASRVSGVKLAVSPGRAPVVAKLHLRAEGSFAVLVPLTGELVSGPPGLVVERLRLGPKDDLVVAELEAFRLERSP